MGGVTRAIGGIFGGGGGGGTTYNVQQPPAPAPIDYDKMYAAATRSAIDQMREQEAQVQRLVPTYEQLQFNTVNRLAQGLDNQYLATLRNTIAREMGAAATPSAIEAELQRRATAEMQQGPTAADRQIQSAGLGAMGVRADQVGTNDVSSGRLGDALMAQAIERSQSGGRLSAEANRDAVQAARAGMASRGMATGSAGLAAEMLNRDRFARARRDEDNAFAGAVQAADLGRQFQNREAQMRAQMANQAANQNQLMQNRAFMLDANTAVLGAEDRRRAQALGANQLDLARRQRLLGLAGGYAELDPYARAVNPAFTVGTANTGTASHLIAQTFGSSLGAAGNVASFNTNMQAGMFNNWQNNNAAIQAANITGRASQNAGQMAMMGGIAQGLGSVNWSDKRMKKDIKPVGKGGGVLGLTAYEYRYKGESKDAPKHVGFMAQDVQKVLPEAVEEIDHKGKKRLAIKPQVIGQALAAELEAQQEAMFAEGYTVK